MANPATKRALAVGMLALVSSETHFSSASAQEYCVACSGPNALYRCALDNAAPTGMPLKLLCTSTLARAGGHATCSVKGGTVFDCDAPIRRIDAVSAASLLARPVNASPEQPRGPDHVAAPAGQGTVTPSTAPPGTAVPAPSKAKPASPPQTVEQLAKEITRASKESLGKAGDTIGGSTRKAWDCVKSLFKSC